MKKLDYWKLLADLNISIKTVDFLKSLGFDIKRVDKSVSTDEELVEIARKEERFILTFDKDFGEIYYFNKDKTITVIVLYLDDQTSESVNLILKNFFTKIKISEVQNKLIILYKYRYRIIG